jgi:hypothetical protein
MVNIHSRFAAYSKLAAPGLAGGVLPVAPPNHLCMLRDYIEPSERAVACPNQDVVYGQCIADFSRGPVILQVPDFGGRFWVYQAVDQRTDSFASLGSMYGTKPGFYLLAGADWKGTAPEGITAVFRCSTRLGAVFPRVFQSDEPEDKVAVQEVLSRINAYPLSEFDERVKTVDWSKVPTFPGDSGSGEVKWVRPEQFVEDLAAVLDTVPPLPGEEALHAEFRSVLRASGLDERLKAAFTEAAVDAEKELVTPLFQFRNYGLPLEGNWTTITNGAGWGTDYFTRLAVAKSNIFVNKAQETRYFYQDLDTQGERLNGADVYTVTFPAGQLPPVEGFWSLTLYNEHHFFHPNDLKRYSLGTKNKGLKFGLDGSLTLYVQAKNPGGDKESNWLPAPEGDFSLYIRAYWPKAEIAEEKWNPPAVTKATLAQSPAAKKTVADASRFEGLAMLPFERGYPTGEASRVLRDELLFQRAVQGYLWSLPAVNMWAMKEGSEKVFGGGYHVLPTWTKRIDAETLVTTPNSDVVYAMGYLDLKQDGPLVVEAPAGVQGMFDDFFQRPLVGPTVDGHTWVGDVGLAGPDEGKGGIYILLPPDYKGKEPKGGFVYRSRTYNVFLFWRSFFKDPKDLGETVARIKATRIYPFGKKDSARPMQFPDASGVPTNLLFPEDGRYFESLARLIEHEYVAPADMDMRGMLHTIGIEKGKPFRPDAEMRTLLDRAARTAFKMSKVVFSDVLPHEPGGRYYPDRQWVNVFAGENTEFQASGTFSNLEQRVAFFTSAYSVSPAMVVNMVGRGAKYPVTARDADGEFLDGGKSYRLHLPANIPVANFWSATVYDALTASGLANSQPFPSLNSMDEPERNADGSTDLYFGPKAPEGKEKNWLATVPGKGYFVIFRLYSPTQAFFDQSWKPGDIEKVK